MSKIIKALEKLAREKRTGEEQSVGSFVREREKPLFLNRIALHPAPKVDSRVVVYHDPTSLIAEEYRCLRTNLKSLMPQNPPKVFLVSSSTQGEGKTITAINLAFSLAQDENKNVLLLDGDLRKGGVGECLGLDEHAAGLTEILRQEIDIQDGLVKIGLERLTVIPKGKASEHPAELLGSRKMGELLEILKWHFDYVVIDSPPILPTTDARILSSKVDGVLMVVQMGRTPKGMLAHAESLFKQLDTKLLGYVLTHCETSFLPYPSSYPYAAAYVRGNGKDRRIKSDG